MQVSVSCTPAAGRAGLHSPAGLRCPSATILTLDLRGSRQAAGRMEGRAGSWASREGADTTPTHSSLARTSPLPWLLAECPRERRGAGGQWPSLLPPGAPDLPRSRLASFALTESCVSFCAGHCGDEKGTKNVFHEGGSTRPLRPPTSPAALCVVRASASGTALGPLAAPWPLQG